MATSLVTTANLSNSSDANLRDWTGRVETLLTAAGWTQVTGIGESATSSFVTSGLAINTAIGFQIWHMARR